MTFSSIARAGACWIRVTGDIIAFSPPLIAEKQHFGEIVSTLAMRLKRCENNGA